LSSGTRTNTRPGPTRCQVAAGTGCARSRSSGRSRGMITASSSASNTSCQSRTSAHQRAWARTSWASTTTEYQRSLMRRSLRSGALAGQGRDDVPVLLAVEEAPVLVPHLAVQDLEAGEHPGDLLTAEGRDIGPLGPGVLVAEEVHGDHAAGAQGVHQPRPGPL